MTHDVLNVHLWTTQTNDILVYGVVFTQAPIPAVYGKLAGHKRVIPRNNIIDKRARRKEKTHVRTNAKKVNVTEA